jgi:hypothetical protein
VTLNSSRGVKDDAGSVWDGHRSCCLQGRSAANRALLLRPTQRPPVRSAGRLRCGDYRLSAASGGDRRPILVTGSARDEKARRSNTSVAGDKRCRFTGAFTGATGLEPATSGVTGQFEGRDVDDDVHATPLLMRCAGAPGSTSDGRAKPVDTFAAHLLPRVDLSGGLVGAARVSRSRSIPGQTQHLLACHDNCQSPSLRSGTALVPAWRPSTSTSSLPIMRSVWTWARLTPMSRSSSSESPSGRSSKAPRIEAP